MTALALMLLLVLGAGGCAPQKEGSVGILYRVTGGKNETVAVKPARRSRIKLNNL